MCMALDMPCGARRDLDHIEAKLYRIGAADISILCQQKYRQKNYPIRWLGIGICPTTNEVDLLCKSVKYI